MARGSSGSSDDNTLPHEEPNADTPPRFYELLRVLGERSVKFILIGGFAVTLQGYTRTTKDIDITPDPRPDNLERLWDALLSVNARPAEFNDFSMNELPVPFSREGLSKGGNWIIYTSFGRLDLMSYVEDTKGELTYEELNEQAERVDLDEIGYPIWVSSVDHLIAMKTQIG